MSFKEISKGEYTRIPVLFFVCFVGSLLLAMFLIRLAIIPSDSYGWICLLVIFSGALWGKVIIKKIVNSENQIEIHFLTGEKIIRKEDVESVRYLGPCMENLQPSDMVDINFKGGGKYSLFRYNFSDKDLELFLSFFERG